MLQDKIDVSWSVHFAMSIPGFVRLTDEASESLH